MRRLPCREDDLAAAFTTRYPGLADRRAVLEAPDIQLLVSAAIPGDRAAALGIEVMRHGKDFLVDKPGALTLQELDDVRAVQAATGRFFTIFYSEHLEQPSTVRAGELVAQGVIGQGVNLVGLGPHRMRRASRFGWFFDRRRGGPVLADIASHQCEQFLFFTGAEDAEVLSAKVANHRLPNLPQFQDVGDIHLRAGGVTGYIRVDWYTLEALPV
jgi:predicted dehydrogenase